MDFTIFAIVWLNFRLTFNFLVVRLIAWVARTYPLKFAFLPQTVAFILLAFSWAFLNLVPYSVHVFVSYYWVNKPHPCTKDKVCFENLLMICRRADLSVLQFEKYNGEFITSMIYVEGFFRCSFLSFVSGKIN